MSRGRRAPSYDDDAWPPDRQEETCGAGAPAPGDGFLDLRSIDGGFLVQDPTPSYRRTQWGVAGSVGAERRRVARSRVRLARVCGAVVECDPDCPDRQRSASAPASRIVSLGAHRRHAAAGERAKGAVAASGRFLSVPRRLRRASPRRCRRRHRNGWLVRDGEGHRKRADEHRIALSSRARRHFRPESIQAGRVGSTRHGGINDLLTAGRTFSFEFLSAAHRRRPAQPGPHDAELEPLRPSVVSVTTVREARRGNEPTRS